MGDLRKVNSGKGAMTDIKCFCSFDYGLKMLGDYFSHPVEMMREQGELYLVQE
jgi:hypothetical protein